MSVHNRDKSRRTLSSYKASLVSQRTKEDSLELVLTERHIQSLEEN